MRLNNIWVSDSETDCQITCLGYCHRISRQSLLNRRFILPSLFFILFLFYVPLAPVLGQNSCSKNEKKTKWKMATMNHPLCKIMKNGWKMCFWGISITLSTLAKTRLCWWCVHDLFPDKIIWNFICKIWLDNKYMWRGSTKSQCRWNSMTRSHKYPLTYRHFRRSANHLFTAFFYWENGCLEPM